MDLIAPPASFCIEARDLGRLMPMHLCLDRKGKIVSAGPTLAKVAGPLIGAEFLAHFEVRRPAGLQRVEALRQNAGNRIHLTLPGVPGAGLRGLAVPMPDGGMLINLSFGIDLPEAVRRHRLSDGDFPPTDLAVEMLYLIEVKSLVMTELHGLNQRLQGARVKAEEQARTDTLTGLRNRRAMDWRLADLAASGKPFGLIHLDLDYFKEVNDTLGHAAGDLVLVAVAEVLISETRRSDTVARIGGDEFVILLPGMADLHRLATIANRIISRLDTPVMYEGSPCRISASIGMTASTLYAPPIQPEQMLADADHALYASKRAGRARATAHGAG